MPSLTTIPPPSGGERDKIPPSAINQHPFCPRRAALTHIQGIFQANAPTPGCRADGWEEPQGLTA